MLRIGVVNIDVSHPKAFAPILKELGTAAYYAVYNEGFRGTDEVEGFRRLAGLDRVCASLGELVACSDVGFVQGCNWDKHLEHAMVFLEAGKPVFLDKPMVGNLRECEKLLELERQGAVILGSSSVRYCREIRDFLEIPLRERGALLHAVATVGSDEFNYAIHGVEGLCALAEAKPDTVRWLGASRQEGQVCDSYFLTFENGATATCHCVADRFVRFHITVLTAKQDFCLTVDSRTLYRPMLEQLSHRLAGKENCLATVEELVRPIRVLLAGKLSRQLGGREVSAWDPALETVSFDGYAFEKRYAAAAKPMYL